jgi:glycosyltransferase involved in cell wall biosynthesis
MDILVAICAHCEVIGLREKRIVERIPATLGKARIGKLLVDDGSWDGTGEEAAAQGAHVITLPHNVGKADALKHAFEFFLEGGCDAMVTMDADGQHDPDDLGRFVELLASNDVVLGERYHPNSCRVGVPLDRELMNLMFAQTVSMLSGRKFYDVLCGFRAFRRPVIEALQSHLKLPEYGVELETVMALCFPLRVTRVATTPISAVYTGTAELAELYEYPDGQMAAKRRERVLVHFDQLQALCERYGAKLGEASFV